MALPTLTEAERKASLEKAKEARLKRAKVRDSIASGELTLEAVIDMKDDPIIGRMKVSALIEALPGYGKATTRKVMDELQIAECRRIRGLSDRQKTSLLDYFG